MFETIIKWGVLIAVTPLAVCVFLIGIRLAVQIIGAWYYG